MDEHHRAVPPGDLLTVAQVAERMQVAESSVRRWIANDQLGFFRTASGSIRVSGVHLQVFLEGHRDELDSEQDGLAASGFYGEEGDG